MTKEENARDELLKRKRAFENKVKAEEAVREAAEAKFKASTMRDLTLEVLVIVGGRLYEVQQKDKDSEEAAALQRTYEKYEREEEELKEEWSRANTEEQEAQARLDQAQARLDQATAELAEVTVEPRVEGSKLSFEVHKLRATVSAASLVGIAAVSGVVLPSTPKFIYVLCISFLCLLVSLVLSLGIMARIGKRIEDALITGGATEDTGIRAELAKWAFPAGIGVFLLFVVLNLLFVTEV